MNSAAPRLSTWFNHLPDWIVQEQEWARVAAGGDPVRRRRLKPQFRKTLEAIASLCDPPQKPGDSLLVAFGGAELIARAGCSRTSFWAHIKRLERLGYVVTIGRGGTIGTKNYGNQYAIPGSRGSLDDRRCRRRMQRMVKGADGKLRPQIIHAGDQVKLFQAALPNHSPVRLSHQNPDGGRVEPGRGSWCGASKRDQEPRSRFPHISVEDLQQTSRLLELFSTCARRGFVDDSANGRLQFVAMAEHALRWGRARDVAAVFVGNVKNGRWLLITPADEDAANGRLKAHEHGDERRREPEPEQNAMSSPQGPALTQDAGWVLACERGWEQRGRSGSPPFEAFKAELGRRTRSEWDADRWEAAREEIRRSLTGLLDCPALLRSSSPEAGNGGARPANNRHRRR